MAISRISILLLLILLLNLTAAPSFSEKCHPNDKKALLQLKKDLHNPSILISWQPNTDCCTQWSGLTCDQKTNRTTQINLSQSNLRLPIPAAVGDLPYLQSLAFYNTSVTGQIPLAISKLSNLHSLDLRYNLLTGPVPGFLSYLKKLRYIALSSNRLTGSIPPSLSSLPELDELQLDHNNLTGSIPESFADFKQQAFFLYLSDNHLSGPIPTKLGSRNFSVIDVPGNRLEGDISFLLGPNKNLLNAVDFSRNLFEFNLSNVVIPNELVILDLSHNKIYGSIPEGFTKTDLAALNVSYNRLCGHIPVGGRFQSLDYTSFFHNKCLCGSPLPKCK